MNTYAMRREYLLLLQSMMSDFSAHRNKSAPDTSNDFNADKFKCVISYVYEFQKSKRSTIRKTSIGKEQLSLAIAPLKKANEDHESDPSDPINISNSILNNYLDQYYEEVEKNTICYDI